MKKFAFIFLSLLFISCGNASEEKELILQKKIDSLQTEIFELQQANDTLSDHLLKKSYLTRLYPDFFQNIQEPEKFLLDKLQENSEAIPKKAVLGGTMRFTSVNFINEELLIAEYEDGHVMGKGIYRYRVDNSEELHFELLTTLNY